ncbi:MAG TPA: hypothetical protein VJO35_13775 [Terriglobales bacterium]|nr:hypothetical protein [Terriglobales bacterium]
MPTFKLGKQRAKHDSRTLQFGTYLTGELPAPPAAVDYGAPVKQWPMMGNDNYGDCTCAAAGHMIEEWTANTGGAEILPDAAILRAYDHFSHGDPEAGANMLDVLNYWRKTGIGGDKIFSFAQLEPQNDLQLKDAISIFGNCYIGLELPDFAVAPGTDFLKNPWSVPAGGPVGNAAPNPNNGHCVPAVAYDSRYIYVVTWGAIKTMSWQFYHAYADEAFAVLSTDWIDKKLGKTPSGFDMAGLEHDLAPVTSAQSKNAVAA